MKACISQVTTLKNPFEADLALYGRHGWTAIELWLTKLESFLETHPLAEAVDLLAKSGLEPVAAASQGGLLLSQGDERKAHWDHFKRRLSLLQELSIGTLIVAPDFVRSPTIADLARAARSLGEAADMASSFGVRIALEFQKSSSLCASVETAIALVAQAGSANAGVCLDVFHYYTGPSKFEDLAELSPRTLAWVQVSDLSGTPRELAGDADRILPGEGDFQLGPIFDQLEQIGYEGHVSLEVLNPHLWQVAPDRVVELGFQALERTIGPSHTGGPAARGGF